VSSPYDVVGAALPKTLSQKKRDEVAEQIVDALWDAGFLTDGVTTVEISGAMVPVETVEAYGLTIRVDANGDAAEISSLRGLEILA
jgi:hypothetical protein